MFIILYETLTYQDWQNFKFRQFPGQDCTDAVDSEAEELIYINSLESIFKMSDFKFIFLIWKFYF